MPHLRALVIAALASLLLAGCTGSPTPATTATPAKVVALMEAVPGVADVEVLGESAVAHAALKAPDAVVVAAAEQLGQIGIEYEWAGRISLARENPNAYDPETDMSRPGPWSVEVFPTEVDDALRNELLGILALEKIDNLVSVTVLDGWPYATLGSMDSFAEDFRTLVAAPMFVDGGTVSLESDGHLRIVWVPTRTSLHAIDEIVSIAADYPAAEVLLEATTAGPQWPTLYIARISSDEASAIEKRLLDPSLADADVDGFGLPFMLRVIGPDGPVYLEGNFGGVVE
ncbi:hypothetical protein BH10ACT7_BH10ACT7_19100 [soil metagenome]